MSCTSFISLLLRLSCVPACRLRAHRKSLKFAKQFICTQGLWLLTFGKKISHRTGFCLGRVGLRGSPARRYRTDPLEIELGRDIRVRIAATSPKELASAIVK